MQTGNGPHASGEARLIELTLFGPGAPLTAWLIEAVRDALDAGLGPKRLRYNVVEIRRVRPGRTEILSLRQKDWPAVWEPDLLNLQAEPFMPADFLTVEFLSPTRLKQDNTFLTGSEPVPFSVLIGRTFDRFRDLYGEAASDVLRKEVREAVLAEADRVQIVANETCWVDVHDYSTRHRRELGLGGKIGRVIYDPGASRFYPILHAAEILHLGKNAASGFGRIRVELSETA